MPDANDGLISQPAQAKMTPDELKEARRKFEAGQTTRRAALRKIGITAGAAFFAMFAVDDLARIAGKRLEQMQIDNKIADDLAKELRSVGVAFAGPGSSGGPCAGTGTANCLSCNTQRYLSCKERATTVAQGDLCQVCSNEGTSDCNSGPNYTQFNLDWSQCSTILSQPVAR